MDKKNNRIRRATKARKKLKQLGAIRLMVHRTPRHIYAQIINPENSRIIVAASSLEKSLIPTNQYTGNKQSANIIGKIIAERAIKKNIKKVSFDRSGFKYHGRIQTLAEAARKAGLKF